MKGARKGVFALLVLLVPVSCKEVFFTEPITCYFLDGILLIYCIAATALYFREKYSFIPPEEGTEEEKGGIYQELERPKGTDIYHILEQTKKKAGKKKKAKKAKEDQEQDQQSVPLQTPPPH